MTATPAPLPADAPPGTSAVHLRWDDGRGTPALLDTTALVRITPGAERELRARLTDVGLVLDRTLMPSLGLVRVRDPAGMRDGITLAALLADVEGVSETVPNLYLPHRAAGEFVPNDPRYGGQWFFKQLNMPAAWAYTQGDPETTVVVIDNGCDLQHPDLVGGLDPGRDVVDDDDDPSFKPNSRSNNHGTACAGNVGAKRDNGIGVAGTAPGVKIMPISWSTTAGAANAFALAVANGARVITNSWGHPDLRAQAVDDQIRSALQANRVVLFAGGNGPDRPPFTYRIAWPAGLSGTSDPVFRNLISVGMSSPTDEHKGVASSDGGAFAGSSYMAHNGLDGPDVCAPGPWSYTTDIRGAAGYNTDGNMSGVHADYTHDFGGTSSSTPKVAGIVGLLLSRNPDLTPAEVKQLLKSTAKDIEQAGVDDKTGSGRVDALAALRAVPGSTFSISGRVTLNGSGLRDVVVSAGANKSATTNASGDY
ncbi:MAG: S8 family serine peptidase, partial [Myxococcota bacterium]